MGKIQPNQVGLVALGQSGFVLRFPSATALIDGFFSSHPERLLPPPFPAASAAGLDLIACTHDHGDHLDRDALLDLAAASPRARFLVPAPIVEAMESIGIPAKRVIGATPNVSLTIANLEIHALSASHGDRPSDGFSFGVDSGGNPRFLGFVFSQGGPAVYHAGDTIGYDGLADRLKDLSVDVALLPINGRDAERESRGIVGNLDAAEAADLATAAHVDVVVPMHYDMFAGNPGFPEELVQALRIRKSRVIPVVLPVGQPFMYSKPG